MNQPPSNKMFLCALIITLMLVNLSEHKYRVHPSTCALPIKHKNSHNLLLSDDAQGSSENKDKQEVTVKDKSRLFQCSPIPPVSEVQPYGQSSVVVNERTVSPTFLEQGNTLIVSGGLMFSLYKQGSGLSRPLGFTLVLSHLAYSAKSKYSLCLCTANFFFFFIEFMCIPMDLFDPGMKFQNSMNHC